MEASNNIKKLRKKNNLTLDELGTAIGTGKATISRYETGSRTPTQEIWDKLAKFFGVSVEYLQGAYSEEEIAKIVQNSYQHNYFEFKKGKQKSHAHMFRPLTSYIVDDYLITLGEIPYNIKKEKYLLSEKEINDSFFWKRILKPLYRFNDAMKWLITKPHLNASEPEVLNAVNGGMTSLINISYGGTYHSDVRNFDTLFDDAAKNAFMKKRNEFLDRHRYWTGVKTPLNHWEENYIIDFEHPHKLDGKKHYIEEIQ